jgi:eukaryotic-like serine/threonine-protein kinase
LTPEVWQRVREMLDHALKAAPEQRAGYLDDACAGDSELRAELESLLASYQRAGDTFLEGRAIEAAGFDADDGIDGDVPLEGQRIGPYQVVEEIGHGGMGVVYRAVRADDQFRKEVAIKVVRGGLSDDLSNQRFKAERQILANLDHPNIARLLDGGAVDGRPYVVMEYVQGVPMDEYCDARKLPVRARLELFRTVCSAVAYAHQRLVIHRDLKPGNILVGSDGQPKLLDFGIAKIVDPDQYNTGDPTVTMVRLMTPEYASPEQMRGEAITTATDVYSLGVVLYGLLSGRRPYRTTGRTPHEMARAVLEQEPERPSASIDRADQADGELVGLARGTSPEKLRRRLGGDLDNIVLKALRKEPERRYVSVEQFSEDVHRHLAGLPVIARPDTFSYRSGKFVRRHKAAVVGATLAVLALVGGIGATMRQAAIARAERARAEQRFYDVRQLANSLLFEVHDAIENLPGSTPARKILVDRALHYLDKLAQEAKGDLSLQGELAAAYEKVGDVQGGYRTANLGDTAGFISSYRRALAIREAVYESDPSNSAAQRELLRTHGRLSDALLAAGDPAGSLEQLRQLLPLAERLAAADPKNLADRRNLALAHLDYGWKSSGNGNWQSGLEECRRAVSILEELASADPKDRRTQRSLALAYGRVGELLSSNSRQQAESLAVHQKALSIDQSLLAEDPRNTDLRRLEAWEILRTGEETAALGDIGGAMRLYDDALIKFRGLSKADPKNVQFHFDVASALARVGAGYLQAGEARSALKELQASLAELDGSNPGAQNTDQLELTAMDQYRIAKAYERGSKWKQSEAWFVRSIPTLEEAAKRGALEGDELPALENARAGLAHSREQLAALNR